jgi:hypothetical protein
VLPSPDGISSGLHDRVLEVSSPGVVQVRLLPSPEETSPSSQERFLDDVVEISHWPVLGFSSPSSQVGSPTTTNPGGVGPGAGDGPGDGAGAGTVQFPPTGGLPSGHIDSPSPIGTVHCPPGGGLPSGQIGLEGAESSIVPGKIDWSSGTVLPVRPGMNGKGKNG